MNSMIGWILAAVFFVTTIVVSILWLLARRSKLAKEGDATTVNGSSFAAPPSLSSFKPDTEYSLLAMGGVNVAGRVKSHGVVSVVSSNASGGPSESVLFLVEQSMQHLEPGDNFKLHNNEPYKIHKRSTEQAIWPAEDAPTQTRAGVQREQPASVSWMPEAPQDDQRTMLFSMAAGVQDPLEIFPYLKVIEGPDTGSKFPLQYQDNQIGRGDTNGVLLTDDGASRNHCKLRWRTSVFELEDLGSTNGTLCNSNRVQTKTLEFGDRIQVSDTVMVFTCRGFELAERDAEKAIAAFQQTLRKQPEFLPALKNLAFLLERDVSRSGEAEPLWKQISILEKNA